MAIIPQEEIEVYGAVPDKQNQGQGSGVSAVILASTKDFGQQLADVTVKLSQFWEETINVWVNGSLEAMVESFVDFIPSDPAKKKKAVKGYVKKSVVDNLNLNTVSIPANFAGLEAEMVPTRLQDQLFRIVEVQEDEDCVTITARHVWYDNLENFTTWAPTKTTKYTAAAVCRNILLNTISPVGSRVASDCKTQIIGKDLDFERKNIVEAFLDAEKGVCEKFGLSLIRNNWDFYCLKDVGYDRGMVIENGKNLLGVTRTESIENLVTRVAPIGKDKKGKLIWLNNNGKKYVDSSHINDYSYPRVEIYDTGLQIGKDDVTAQNINSKLLTAAQKRFSDDKVDIPEVEMEIEFLSLGDTEEYVQYRDLDKVYLYDILTIKDTIRGYNYSAQVIGVEHDILTGMLNSVTIGKFNNAPATRKIASWQVPEVDGTNIRLMTIMPGSFEEGAIYGEDIAEGVIAYAHFASATIDELNADAIEAVTANIQEIIAGKVTAESIDTDSIDAINATLGIAQIADAEIASARIGYGQIVDADVQNLIAHDAVTDRYYIDKLAVNNAQAVSAQIGELIVKASDDNYYKLDIDANGAVNATNVTSMLTQAEINAGVTANGKSSIIETDLTASELSATNMKGLTALIAKITAARIDVDELFARNAMINHLNTADISNNQYISLAVRGQLGQGRQYMQVDEPTNPQEGDIWHRLMSVNGSATWEYLEDKTWEELEETEWYKLTAIYYETYCYDGTAWQQIEGYTNAQVGSIMPDGDMITGIAITQDGIQMDGNKYIRMNTAQQTNMELSREGISMETAGRAYLHAADASRSAIIFGSDIQNANFAVDITGDMYAKSVSTDALTLGGCEMPKIIVDANQPTGHNILWVKPSSTTGKQWGVYPDNNKINQSGGTLDYYRDFTIPYAAADYLAGNLYYGARVRLYVYQLDLAITPNVTLKARLKNGNSWIDLGEVTKRFFSPGYLELDNDLTTLNTNVMNVSGGTFTVRIETNYNYNNCRLASENIVLRAMTTGGAGVASCDIYYIN